MKQKKSYLLSRFFFYGFLLSFPLTVTLSQACMILSTFFFLGDSEVWKRENRREIFGIVFLTGIGIYLSIFFMSFPARYGEWASGDFWKDFSRGETSDFWMTLGIPLAIYHIKFATPRIPFFLVLGACLNLIAGMVSVFTPYRLAKFIQLGFTYPEGERLQHFAGGIWDVGTYLPLGLMMTHLTYGGLLGMLAPGVLFYVLVRFRRENYSLKWGFFLLFLLLFNSFLLFYNQSRSIWVGILVLAFLALFYLGVRVVLQRKITNKQILKVVVAILIVGSGFLYVGNKLYESNWLVRRAIQDSFVKKTTENQRYFILKNSFKLIEKNWLTGVGNNQFEKQHDRASHEMIRKHEWLWYELAITPRGHSHHDFLHFWAVGGVFAGFFFLMFWSLLWGKFWDVLHDKFSLAGEFRGNMGEVFLGVGVLVIFPAGFFQCYMLDDEVALPFYVLTGMFWGYASLKKNSTGLSDTNIGNIGSVEKISLSGRSFRKGFLTVGILLGMSILYWQFRTLPAPEDIHERKVIWDRKDSGDWKEGLLPIGSVHLEGCLSHRYGNSRWGLPIQVRNKPMKLSLRFPQYGRKKDVYPTRIKVQIFDRDSFDQDKLYRAHESSLLSQKWIIVEKELNIRNKEYGKKDRELLEVSFPESVITEESESFPGKVRFRDFRVEFFKDSTANPREHIYPDVELGKLCD